MSDHPDMTVSMTLPTMTEHDRQTLLTWCREVDAGPWESLAVPERTTYTSHDLIVQLAAAAMLTERVRLWSTIVILPAHDAVDVAKKMASIDVLSDGRLSVGVGVGGREHDYLALGASFANRWARLDAAVATMQRIWAGEPPFADADPVGPIPVQPGGPPIFGSSMGPKSMARAAKWAAGINGAWTITGDTSGVAGGVAMTRAAWEAAGRTEAPHLSTNVWFALGDDAQPRLASYVHSYMKIFGDKVGQSMGQAATCFGEDALVKLLDDCRHAGLDEVFLVPTTDDPAELARAAAVVAG